MIKIRSVFKTNLRHTAINVDVPVVAELFNQNSNKVYARHIPLLMSAFLEGSHIIKLFQC